MLSLSLSIAISELPRRYDLINVVTLHTTLLASGSLTYAVRPECLLDLNSRPQWRLISFSHVSFRYFFS